MIATKAPAKPPNEHLLSILSEEISGRRTNMSFFFHPQNVVHPKKETFSLFFATAISTCSSNPQKEENGTKMPTLPKTNSSHLKIDLWKRRFLLVSHHFQVRKR